MFGLFYMGVRAVMHSIVGIDNVVQDSKAKQKAARDGRDKYFDHKGIRRYVENDAPVVVTNDSNGHLVEKNPYTGKVYKDLYVEARDSEEQARYEEAKKREHNFYRLGTDFQVHAHQYSDWKHDKNRLPTYWKVEDYGKMPRYDLRNRYYLLELKYSDDKPRRYTRYDRERKSSYRFFYHPIDNKMILTTKKYTDAEYTEEELNDMKTVLSYIRENYSDYLYPPKVKVSMYREDNDWNYIDPKVTGTICTYRGFEIAIPPDKPSYFLDTKYEF